MSSLLLDRMIIVPIKLLLSIPPVKSVRVMGKHTPRLVVILSTITIEVHNEINHNPSPNEGGMLCLGIKRMTMF